MKTLLYGKYSTLKTFVLRSHNFQMEIVQFNEVVILKNRENIVENGD